MKKKVLWISRHTMTPEQLNDLERIMGGEIETRQWVDTVKDLSELVPAMEDVDAVANHVPEAVIFDMTDLIAQKKYNSAMAVLGELLADKNNEPIPMLAVLGLQMRKLYAARLAIDKELGTKFVMEACAIKYDYIASKLISSARGFSLPQLKRAVEICAETDHRIKSSAQDDRELLKEAVLRIAAGEGHA